MSPAPLSVDAYSATLRVEIAGAVRALRLDLGALRALQAEATAARRALAPEHPPVGPEWIARELVAGRALADDVQTILRLAAVGGGADGGEAEAVAAAAGRAPARWRELAVALIHLALTGPEDDALPPFAPAGGPPARNAGRSKTARSAGRKSTATAR